jgi:hypothetical protein
MENKHYAFGGMRKDGPPPFPPKPVADEPEPAAEEEEEAPTSQELEARDKGDDEDKTRMAALPRDTADFDFKKTFVKDGSYFKKDFIKKSGSGFSVHAENGKLLGRHPTREKAAAQLRAIEASKHAK